MGIARFYPVLYTKVMIRLKEIAKIAGVSPATVSNVLNGKDNVGEETKRRILQLCTEYSYNPNITERKYKRKAIRTILFTFSDFERCFYLDIIKGIHDFAETHSYDLLISTGKISEKYMHPSITSGCIALDGHLASEILLRNASEDYPIISLDRELDNPYIKSILVDNYPSMKALMESIINKGYKSFAYLGGLETTADNKERYKAFLDVLNEHNIPFKSDWNIAGNWLEKSGIRAAQIMMLSKSLPEVLVCANDNMAFGAIKTFKANGYEIGKDIMVTGFDNNLIAEFNEITTIDIPDYERGYLAAQALVNNIEGEKNNEVFRISAKIIYRKSFL